MGVPKMDGLQGKIPLKWMIWGYPYSRKPSYIYIYLHIYIYIYINPFHESLEISQTLLLAASHVTHCFTSSLVA